MNTEQENSAAVGQSELSVGLGTVRIWATVLEGDHCCMPSSAFDALTKELERAQQSEREGWRYAKELEQELPLSNLRDLQRDAKRYRRLCWLVEFGEWCVGKSEIVDSHGLTKEEWMGDKTHMDATLDRQDVIQDAESSHRALSSNISAHNAGVTGAEPKAERT